MADTIPTAVMTASQTSAVEPGQTVTLSLYATDDVGVSAHTVRQISGPSVSLSGSDTTRSFAAPYTVAGTTLQFGYKATDTAGQESAEATITITVLRCTVRLVTVGGATPVEVPLQRRFIS
jgi:hypothetical protein